MGNGPDYTGIALVVTGVVGIEGGMLDMQAKATELLKAVSGLPPVLAGGALIWAATDVLDNLQGPERAQLKQALLDLYLNLCKPGDEANGG